MIKLLHTADIHLDSPLRSLALRDENLREQVQAATRGAFNAVVEHALNENVSALLIAGDLFDGAARSAKTAAFLVRELDRLRVEDIQVFYIKGNHDAENPISGEVALPDNVHVFDGRGSKVQVNDSLWIHGVSFSGKQAPESLLHKFPSPVPHAVNIALLHTSLAGASGHDPYAPCSLTELQSMGFDYWALGHIHKRQVHSQDPWVVMPGMPQGRDIGESGPKSATLLCIDEGNISVEELATSQVEFMAHAVDISSIDSDDQLRRIIREELASLVSVLVPRHAILRLTLAGSPEQAWQIVRDTDLWTETVMQLALETGRLSIDKVQFEFDSTATLQVQGSPVDELLNHMHLIRDEDAFKTYMKSQVQQVLSQMPAQVRSKLIPDEAAMHAIGKQASAEGAAHLHALMKGASQ